MTEGSFAEFVPRAVINQINIREDKWGKPDKTVEEFEVIHGNTVWCVLRSGVNTPVDPNNRTKVIAGPARNTVKCSDRDARNLVFGGDLKQEVPTGNEFSFDSRAGIELSTLDIATAAYRKDSVQGHRPVPGITGFSVKTKDTWGMILEANINIKCWSRDDLEKLDLVYFKPGFPALFEWGHSLYFDEQGNICKHPKPIVSNSEFFGSEPDQDWEKFDSKIYKGRQESCNREAVFGYITNFSWSFNADGSYDCTLQILSKGGVLEGLQMTSFGEKSNTEKQENVEWWNTSPFHSILKAFEDRWSKGERTRIPDRPNLTNLDKDFLECYKMPGQGSYVESDNLISAKEAIESSEHTIKLPGLWNMKLEDFPVAVVPPTDSYRKSKQVECYYMTLRSLLHLINVVSGQVSGVYFDTTSQAVFGSWDHLPSLNPLIAIKPYQAADKVYYIDKGKQLSEAKGTQTQCTDNNQVLNIWINYNNFVRIIETMVQSLSESYPVEKAVMSFLVEIQKAFGNINTFGLHTNDALSGTYHEVVDRSMVRPESLKDVPKLNVTGLRNTVVDLQVKSDISNDIANTMCIAAASPVAKTDGANLADSEVVFWGENCKPRFRVKQGEPSESVIEEQQKEFEEQYKEFEEKLKKVYKKLRRGNFSTKDKTAGSPAGTEALMSEAESDISYLQVEGERYYRNEKREQVTNGNYLHMGLIPYKMSLTMLGISRLLIGNTFMLQNNGIIPRKYDNWGYIITGINHIVRNNQWFTEITTNYFPVFPEIKSSGRKVRNSELEDDGSELSLVDRLRQKLNRDVDRSRPRQKSDLEALENDCDYRVAFTQHSGIDYPAGRSDYGGRCARYTYNWAKAYVEGKSALQNGGIQRNGNYEPSYPAGGNANDRGYWNNLTGLGYAQGSEMRMSAAELRGVKGGSELNGVKVKEGDVLVFEAEDGSKFHTCFYDGTQWCSDTDQSTANCYSAERSYSVRLFSSPPKSRDWDCGVHTKSGVSSASEFSM